MTIFILFSLSSLIGMLNSVLSKKFQQNFSADFTHFIAYNFINALFACVYFFAANSFSLKPNGITFFFAVLFALIVISILILQILALSVTSVSMLGIFSTAGSTILSTVFGLFFLGEPSSPRLFLSLFLLLAAVVIPYIPGRRVNKKNSFLICLLMFIVSGLSVILQKIYTNTPGALSSTTFFLLTNLVIVFVCGFILLAKFLSDPASRTVILKPFSKKQYLNIAIRTAASNSTSVITLLLLSRMDVSVYSVVSSSLGILTGAFLSKVVFKEPMPLSSWIAVALVISSILLNV